MRKIPGGITSHCGVMRHLTLMRLEQDPICRDCLEEEETIAHLLGECACHTRTRVRIFGQDYIGPEEFHTLSMTNILKYFDNIGLFNRETWR